MIAGHEAPGPPDGKGAAVKEEQAELEALRAQADQAAVGAADTFAELTARLSPRNIVAPRQFANRLGGIRAVRIAAVVVPLTAALAAAVVTTVVVRRRRADA